MSAVAEYPRADHAANNVDPMLMAQALDHIARTAKASRSQTRRIRWIKVRAEMALAGQEYRDIDIDLPKKVPETHERIQKRMAYHIAVKHELLDLLQELITEEGPQPGTSEWAARVTATIANARQSVTAENTECGQPTAALAVPALNPNALADAKRFAQCTHLDGESIEQGEPA